MSIEVIPAGASAVVSDDKCARDIALMEAVKDAECDLERSAGLHYGDTVKTVKDVEAGLERTAGVHYGDTVKTVKDAQADLERSTGLHYGDTVKTVKDAEANLERSAGTRYGNTLQAVKDAECNIDRLAANRFTETVEDIKETEIAVERAHGVTRDVVRQSEIATEAAKAKIVDTVRKSEFNAERGENQTRALMAAGYADLKNSVFNTEKELGYTMLKEFKDRLVEDKKAQGLAYRLAAETEKAIIANAAANQLNFTIADKDRAAHATANALAFKEVELRQERLAAQASKEAFAHHSELKDLIRVDGQQTRDLIKNQEMERLRERALKAEAQIAAYFSAKAVPLTPIG